MAAEKPVDLTGSDADTFKALVGKSIILRGQLDSGMQGLCLTGATPTNVVFYVVPEMPPSGYYKYPPSWTRLLQKKVILTGELRFRSFDRTNLKPSIQVPPDYYYMVLQRSRVEEDKSK